MREFEANSVPRDTIDELEKMVKYGKNDNWLNYNNVCPRSCADPFHTVTYNIKWARLLGNTEATIKLRALTNILSRHIHI